MRDLPKRPAPSMDDVVDIAAREAGLPCRVKEQVSSRFEPGRYGKIPIDPTLTLRSKQCLPELARLTDDSRPTPHI